MLATRVCFFLACRTRCRQLGTSDERIVNELTWTVKDLNTVSDDRTVTVVANVLDVALDRGTLDPEVRSTGDP